jgi:hypothetical protein
MASMNAFGKAQANKQSSAISRQALADGQALTSGKESVPLFAGALSPCSERVSL